VSVLISSLTASSRQVHIEDQGLEGKQTSPIKPDIIMLTKWRSPRKNHVAMATRSGSVGMEEPEQKG
jgi:hypothetical protein